MHPTQNNSPCRKGLLTMHCARQNHLWRSALLHSSDNRATRIALLRTLRSDRLASIHRVRDGRSWCHHESCRRCAHRRAKVIRAIHAFVHLLAAHLVFPRHRVLQCGAALQRRAAVGSTCSAVRPAKLSGRAELQLCPAILLVAPLLSDEIHDQSTYLPTYLPTY